MDDADSIQGTSGLQQQCLEIGTGLPRAVLQHMIHFEHVAAADGGRARLQHSGGFYFWARATADGADSI